jgi:hypothetical protein
MDVCVVGVILLEMPEDLIPSSAENADCCVILSDSAIVWSHVQSCAIE